MGSDGNLWFTEFTRIGRITPAGVITEFSAGISPAPGNYQIAAGPDGNLWFTESAINRIGRITPAGVVTEFSTGITSGGFNPDNGQPLHAEPVGITAGPDGNLWFTEFATNRVGRITTAGVITEFAAGITGPAQPRGITTGPDGNLWFAEESTDRIGRLQ
jgi:virginiamycin B lyase